jgi:hypothetical protein
MNGISFRSESSDSKYLKSKSKIKGNQEKNHEIREILHAIGEGHTSLIRNTSGLPQKLVNAHENAAPDVQVQ